ncbi:hypothetical protein [Sorangium sp. So ce542]|uniref:hypothetical protein n=1 Tax=Sorangium sp. So ce542 TaxID=3133316 RepID=UPI003F606A60
MKGRLHLTLRSAEGVTERRAGNAVMRGGGELIARLFAGKGSPITHMAVGTSGAEEAETFSTASLANGGADGVEPLTGGTEVAIPADSFTIDVDPTKRVVWVRLRVTVPGAVGVGTIREAGLVSRAGDTAVLYNRVTFAPVTKRSGDELTLFWEVSFPYGDVQWLM